MAEKYWEVVGGSDKGGILVRTGRETTSPEASQRLATGALVQEEELVGDRLRYRLVKGEGPDSGWVSTKLKDKALLQRCEAPPEGKAASAASVPAVAVKVAELERFSGHPSLKLNTGGLMPIFGLGTWDSPKGQVTEAVLEAIEAGYRHIDCARVYNNEKEVGEALRQAMAKGLVKREDLFITSKLWNADHGPKVAAAVDRSLADLGCGYLDLYLIHWPFSGPIKPLPTLGETWQGMEKAYNDGKCRAIGLSNCSSKKIEEILRSAKVTPAVNQVELHPYLPQRDLIEFCRSKGIAVTAYSPLGSPGHYGKGVLADPSVTKIAKKLGRTPAQVLIRWAMERGTIVIPKSVHAEYIRSNLDVFDWELPAEDFQALSDITKRQRYITGFNFGTPGNPFKNPLELYDDPEGLPS